MYDIITKLTIKETENYDSVMKQIVDSNEILKGKQFKLITAGFTNTSCIIYLPPCILLKISRLFVLISLLW